MDNVKILADDKDISGLSNTVTFVQLPNSQDCHLLFRVFFGSTGASSVALLEELSRADSTWVCGEDKFRGKIKEYSVESTKGTELITCSVVVDGVVDAPVTKSVVPRFEKSWSEKKLEVEYGQNSS